MKQAYPESDPHKDNNAVAFAFSRKGEEPKLCGPVLADYGLEKAEVAIRH